jgi:hypothetical protein
MLAAQLAQARDMFMFQAVVLGIMIPGLLMRARHTRNPAFAAPAVPLTGVLAYQWDLAYGTKVHRIRAEAERILAQEAALLAVPGGPPTVHSIDAALAGEAPSMGVAEGLRLGLAAHDEIGTSRVVPNARYVQGSGRSAFYSALEVGRRPPSAPAEPR